MKREARFETQQRVVDAAREYLTEVDNPAPDLLHRRRLRDRLATMVRAHDVEIGRIRKPSSSEEAGA